MRRGFSTTSQKLVLRLGLRPAPLTPDFASQTMQPPARKRLPQQRTDGQVGGGGIAARVATRRAGRIASRQNSGKPYAASASSSGAVCGSFVPPCIGLGCAQPETRAQIHHFDARLEQGGSEFHGNVGGGRKKHHSQALGTRRFRRACDPACPRVPDLPHVAPVFHQYRFSLGVAL